MAAKTFFSRWSAASIALLFVTLNVQATQHWSSKLDGRISFYQLTELGVIVVSTEKSLYALDGDSGEVIWRRKNLKLEETDLAPIPGTDLLLVTPESGSRTRVEAIDIVSGESIWRSDKVRGSVMQMALDQNSNLLAAVFVKNARGRAREGFKRKPEVHVFDVSTGRQIWKRELENEIEMMPARWSENDDVPYTLDNYRPPVFLDNRLYLFYEGLSSQDAFTGRDRRTEKFRINEEGLALTESDPVADMSFVYVSGRGRVRAISRNNGAEVWEAKDLGSVPEMLLTNDRLYVRTGGQFARLRDGENVSRGPYGLSAINAKNGKVLWRYKGADKGITNFTFVDARTLVVADRDDLLIIDSDTGKRRAKVAHGVEAAAFVLVNERGEAVVGGKNELAAFDPVTNRNTWRSRHNPPARGILRTAAAVAARATALYFRYGSTASTAFRGIQLLNAANSFRWSGVIAREALPSLSSLATNYARDYARERVSTYGLLSQARESSLTRRRIVSRPSVDVEDRLLDRLDPAGQMDRLSRFLVRTRRLAALRGNWMYFYTNLSGRKGLVGVNVNDGDSDRFVRLENPDERFVSDEGARLLYTSDGNRLLAYQLNVRD